MITATALTDWLQAIGGIGGAVTALVLALLAYFQMRASREQAEATNKQVQLMATDAENERRHRDVEDERREAEQVARDNAVRDQIAAVADIARATREASRDAARAQLQPIVFAHAHGGAVRGPDDELDIGDDEVAFLYYLSNEGTGPALNIKHGVECGGTDYAFGGGMEFRTARTGEYLPPLDTNSTQPVPSRFLSVVVAENALPVRWQTMVRTYWARYENVFGEEFETRNPSDPRQSAGFMRITPLGPPSA